MAVKGYPLKEEDKAAMVDYWQRKEEELVFLERFARPLPERTPPEDLDYFLSSVGTLREYIQRRQVEKTAGLPETSPLLHHRYECPGGSVEYSYQRYDLRRIEVEWLKEIYFTRVEGRFNHGLFLASGMSGIAALLAVIARRGWMRVQFSAEGYFESYLLVTRFFQQITLDQTEEQFSCDRDVLWLDTCSSQWPAFPEKPGVLSLIVIDTSCIEPDSRHVERWLHDSARLRCPLVLVRSHMKLDSFGLELGRLGSVVAVAPGDDSEPTRDLIQDLLQARSGFGTGFNLFSLYPWLGDPEFARLSRLRTQSIRCATRYLTTALREERRSGDPFEVLSSNHNIFLVIRTHLQVTNETVQSLPPWCAPTAQPGTGAITPNILSRKIAEVCSDRGLPVIAASSFGLDQIVLLDYVNMHDGQHHLRVSGADIPHCFLTGVVSCIRKILIEFAGADIGTSTNH